MKKPKNKITATSRPCTHTYRTKNNIIEESIKYNRLKEEKKKTEK